MSAYRSHYPHTFRREFNRTYIVELKITQETRSEQDFTSPPNRGFAGENSDREPSEQDFQETDPDQFNETSDQFDEVRNRSEGAPQQYDEDTNQSEEVPERYDEDRNKGEVVPDQYEGYTEQDDAPEVPGQDYESLEQDDVALPQELLDATANPAEYDPQPDINWQCSLQNPAPAQNEQNWQDIEQEFYVQPEWAAGDRMISPQYNNSGPGNLIWPNATFNWVPPSIPINQPLFLQVDNPADGVYNGVPFTNPMQYQPRPWYQPPPPPPPQWPRLQWQQNMVPPQVYPRPMSSGSFTDFTRGAQAAPHSSETDMNVPPAWPCSVVPPGPDGCMGCTSQMSSQQLAVSVSAHTRALSLLLQETALRSQYVPPTTSPMMPVPPRGRVPPPAMFVPAPAAATAMFPAQGFLAGPPVMRNNRGRLHEQNTQVGINMGRPYRY